jgi:hypothetical protein
MLAGVRSCFLLSFLLAFFFAAGLPVQAQVNGVPASVTSLGFGGHFTPGPRASVTSLGPNGFGTSQPIFGCCANFFVPVNPNRPLFPGRHHRRHGDHDNFPIGVMEPAYIPYPVPYAVAADGDPYGDEDAPDADYVRASGRRKPAPPDKDAIDRDPTGYDADPRIDALSKPASVEERPVTAQPSTVLVFKDGHQSDVLNYAIVGDTLFDFGTGRTKKILLADLDLPATRKANDERGVDFQIPASAKGQ